MRKDLRAFGANMNAIRFGILSAFATVVLLAVFAPSASAATHGDLFVPVPAPNTLGPAPATVAVNPPVDMPGLTTEDNEVHMDQVVGGPCGCNCPVVGAGATLGLAGQEVRVVVATVVVLCGTGVWADVVPGDVDPSQGPSIEPILFAYGGGLGQLPFF